GAPNFGASAFSSLVRMLMIQAACKGAAGRRLDLEAKCQELVCALFSRPRQTPEATTSLHEAMLAAAFPLTWRM
ncbi:MAG: hypothetical protein ACJ8EN_17420, partial [Xanthobacteraceae bacterium]